MKCFFCGGKISSKGKCSPCSKYPISNVCSFQTLVNLKPSGSFYVKIGKTKFGVICHSGGTEILTDKLSYVMRLDSQPLNPSNAFKKLPIYLTFK